MIGVLQELQFKASEEIYTQRNLLLVGHLTCEKTEVFFSPIIDLTVTGLNGVHVPENNENTEELNNAFSRIL